MDRDHHPAPRSDNAQAARLRIDLDALAANHAALRREAAGAEVAPVLKADAYGLGAAEVGRRLWAEGARTFFVARLAEGVALRLSLGPARAARIYVLDGCAAGAEGGLHAAALTPVLNSLEQVEAWSRQAAREGRALDAALHIDTGLNRLGLRLEEAEALAATPDRLRGIELTLVMSHLACADLPGHPLTARQAEALARARRLFSGVPASLASSAGAFQGESLRFDMVRPGISLYGGGPFGRPHPAIRSVAHVAAPLIQARTVPPGETVGYGASFTAPRAMRVGIVAAGYADGLLRSASGDGYGWLHGAPRPYLGRVSMDLIALDLSGCDAQPGDEVELLGEHVNVDDHARAAGTIALEVLTRLGPRLARTYVGAVQA